MTADELNGIGQTIEALADRALAAEARATRAEGERDELRPLLTRMRTTLYESSTLSEGRR